MLIQAEVSQYSSLLNKATSEEGEKRGAGGMQGLLGTRHGEDRKEAKDLGGSGRGEGGQEGNRKKRKKSELWDREPTGSQ